jgi:hypothetical protein
MSSRTDTDIWAPLKKLCGGADERTSPHASVGRVTVEPSAIPIATNPMTIAADRNFEVRRAFEIDSLCNSFIEDFPMM